MSSEDVGFGCGILALIGGSILAILLLVAVAFWVGNEMAFPGYRAEVEQLRADAANVDPQQAEDVIGQVTQWNQTIASNQAYNDMPIIGLVIPDGWDDIEAIPVPAP